MYLRRWKELHRLPLFCEEFASKIVHAVRVCIILYTQISPVSGMSARLVRCERRDSRVSAGTPLLHLERTSMSSMPSSCHERRTVMLYPSPSSHRSMAGLQIVLLPIARRDCWCGSNWSVASVQTLPTDLLLDTVPPRKEIILVVLRQCLSPS